MPSMLDAETSLEAREACVTKGAMLAGSEGHGPEISFIDTGLRHLHSFVNPGPIPRSCNSIGRQNPPPRYACLHIDHHLQRSGSNPVSNTLKLSFSAAC